MTADDVFNLDRFVQAQASAHDQALGELAAGRKRSHWMWFVFPQAAGLGHSELSRRYGIASLSEARAYLAHPVLGPRLRACTAQVVDAPEGTSLSVLLGPPDDLKFISSMTLFKLADDREPLFARALERYHAGRVDDRTLAIVARWPRRRE